MACRSLTYLMEALPASAATIVSAQAVPLLCARLLSVQYIDLAEQAVQCLEKISFEHPSSIISNGGLMACLSYLEFFQTNTQRICVATVANVCKQITPDKFSYVVDIVPNLTNLIHFSDQKGNLNKSNLFFSLQLLI